MTVPRWLLLIAVAFGIGVLGWVTVERRAIAAVVREDPERVLSDEHLAAIALPLGRRVYEARCATCHGDAGQPDHARGVPDLRDADWLYGTGRVAEIEAIARHGIRAGDRKGWNLAAMPVYASPRPYAAEPIPPLTPAGARDVTQFVLSLSGTSHDHASAERGRVIYAGQGGCWDCHGADAHGDSAVGAPDLTDRIWLFGTGDAASIQRSIERGRAGISPAFVNVLNPAELRAVAVYVASLSRPSSERSSR
jgi:cytochrome c oxidase cbb3-type subunit 3